jgi:hypothetical protein
VLMVYIAANPLNAHLSLHFKTASQDSSADTTFSLQSSAYGSVTCSTLSEEYIRCLILSFHSILTVTGRTHVNSKNIPLDTPTSSAPFGAI